MSHHDHHRDIHHSHGGSIFDNKMTLPVLIIALTLALMTTFQMRQIMTERKAVREAFATQEQALGQVQQVNKQFESLAVGTARLAGEGNATAQGIVADLKRVGISINPNAKGSEKAIQQVEPEKSETPTPEAAPALANPAANPAVEPAANSAPAAAPAN